MVIRKRENVGQKKGKKNPLISVTSSDSREEETKIQEDHDLSRVIELVRGINGSRPQVLDS